MRTYIFAKNKSVFLHTMLFIFKECFANVTCLIMVVHCKLLEPTRCWPPNIVPLILKINAENPRQIKITLGMSCNIIEARQSYVVPARLKRRSDHFRNFSQAML